MRNAMPNGPTMQNGPARQMNHKEKTELEELLKGIGEDVPDSDSKGSVEEVSSKLIGR